MSNNPTPITQSAISSIKQNIAELAMKIAEQEQQKRKDLGEK